MNKTVKSSVQCLVTHDLAQKYSKTWYEYSCECRKSNSLLNS